MSHGTTNATAAIRIFSSVLTARAIQEALLIPATRMLEAGTRLSPRNPKSAKSERAMWMKEADVSRDRPIEDHLAWLTDLVDSHRQELGRIMSDVEIDYYCGVFVSAGEGQLGMMISNELMSRLSRIPADLVVEFYY